MRWAKKKIQDRICKRKVTSRAPNSWYLALLKEVVNSGKNISGFPAVTKLAQYQLERENCWTGKRKCDCCPHWTETTSTLGARIIHLSCVSFSRVSSSALNKKTLSPNPNCRAKNLYWNTRRPRRQLRTTANATRGGNSHWTRRKSSGLWLQGANARHTREATITSDTR